MNKEELHMRRSVVLTVTLLAACVLHAGSASAQTVSRGWLLAASAGPSFTTLGASPSVDLGLRYQISKALSVGGEYGMLPRVDATEGAGTIAPPLDPVFAPYDTHVNAYHANVNLFYRPGTWNKVSPYVTGGVGTFMGSTIARAARDGSDLLQSRRTINAATNLGAGVIYPLNRWLALQADYRHYLVNATDTQHVNRFTTGVSFFVG
jgi:opacity protein-like surface antigen